MEKNVNKDALLSELCSSGEQSKAIIMLMYRKIARLFEKIIEVDFDGFVGETFHEDKKANRPTDMVDVAMFGDYYFNFRDVLTVIVNLRFWLERYGTVEALRSEIIDWYDYVTDKYTIGKNKVSLFAWLSGCPREEEGGKDGTD